MEERTSPTATERGMGIMANTTTNFNETPGQSRTFKEERKDRIYEEERICSNHAGGDRGEVFARSHLSDDSLTQNRYAGQQTQDGGGR